MARPAKVVEMDDGRLRPQPQDRLHFEGSNVVPAREGSPEVLRSSSLTHGCATHRVKPATAQHPEPDGMIDGFNPWHC